MTYEISEDRSCLTLQVDKFEQANLQSLRKLEPEQWGTWRTEAQVLENLLGNSELDWVQPTDTSDMTDAPLLGIVGNEEERTREQTGPYGAVLAGGDEGGAWYVPILERWGYAEYALHSFMDDLANKGEAVFLNRW
jgi:hypothetical protein